MVARPLRMPNPDQTSEELVETTSPMTGRVLPDLSQTPDPARFPQEGDGIEQLAPAPAAPTLVNSGSNKPATRDDERKKLLSEARQYGNAEGTGKRAFISFGRLLVKGGAAETLSPSPKSKDSSDIYDAFSTGSHKAATTSKVDGKDLVVSNDDRAKSVAAQLSKVRALIRLGANYKDEGESIFEDALQVHGLLMADTQRSEFLKLRSTYAAIVSLAVAHNKLKTKVRMTKDEISALMLNEQEPRKKITGADLLVSAMITIEKAQRGRAQTENTAARAPIDHAALPHLISILRETIGEVDPERLKLHDAEVAAKETAKKVKQEVKAKKDADEAAKKAAKDAELAAKAAQVQPSPAPPPVVPGTTPGVAEVTAAEVEPEDDEHIEGLDNDDEHIEGGIDPDFDE